MNRQAFIKAMQRAVCNAADGKRFDLPAGGHLYFNWFSDLCRSRSAGFSGADPITYSEIDAYARRNRIPLEDRHVDVLMAMDGAWRKHCAELSGRDQEKFAPRNNGHTLQPAAFDAVFG